MTLNSLNGTECSTEIIKKINDIIAQKATISLSNLDSAGEQRFTTLAQGISDANDLITALTTVVGTKLSAQVSLQQNGYIKFSNLVCLQWGSYEKTLNISGPGYADSDTVTLPIAGEYIRSVIAASSSAGTFCSTSIHNASTIGIRVGSIGTKTNAGTTIRWITIGH